MIQCPVCGRPMTMDDDSGFYECCTRIDSRRMPNLQIGQRVNMHADCCNGSLVFQKYVGLDAHFACDCGQDHVFHA